MYVKRVEIENVGPLSELIINFDFNDNGTPKPVVIVGENGSGKSIFLSYLINSLTVMKQEFYDDVEVEKGKVYKYRSPNYVRTGSHYSYSSVSFTSDIFVKEWQLLTDRQSFETSLNYTPARKDWMQIPQEESSHFETNFNTKRVEAAELIKKQCCLYFPVNRFEEPAWLNYENLTNKANYTDIKKLTGLSNRNIISISPLKENQNWLLDLIFDRQAFEIKTHQVSIAPNVTLNHFAGYEGKSTTIYNTVISVLKIVLREKEGNIRFGVGTRGNRKISVMKDDAPWVPNIFQLSTGETQLLNLFLSIIRDYDLSEGVFNTPADVKGIVIIDEIDAHLHTAYQTEVLPELISLFPLIQFIVTTHSPLFLMGLEERTGLGSFDIIALPEGVKTVASDYSEFVEAYNAFKATNQFRQDIQIELIKLSKPIVFVEGDYDIRYLRKAAEHLGKLDLLSKIDLKDGDGFGNLDKIWKGYDNHISSVLPNKLILLYDCDTNKQNSLRGNVYKRVITSDNNNPIAIGIENLLTARTVDLIETNNPQYIDIQPENIIRKRGAEIVIPAKKSVNKDEKGNMCNWLCQHGEKQDFDGFSVVFEIIEEIIND